MEELLGLAPQSAAGSNDDVPADHLDYTFVERCSDAKYLKRILAMLLSGQHGEETVLGVGHFLSRTGQLQRG